jgi:hypothetical protein
MLLRRSLRLRRRLLLMRLIDRRAIIAGTTASALVPRSLVGPPKQMCGAVADAPSGDGGGGLVCSPTVNPVPYVQMNVSVGGIGTGYPIQSFPVNTPFSFFLHSSWHCNPIAAPSQGCNMAFGSVNFFSCGVSNYYGSTPTCEVKVMSLTSPLYDATFALPANQQWHILVSVSCLTQTVQVYCNDQPLTVVSGGWTASGQMEDGTFQDVVLNNGSVTLFAGVADIWEYVTPSWVDLSLVANRRKFINADLSPVDLGSAGNNPFGTPPQIYLTAPSSPSDFLVNRGSGGGPFVLGPGASLTAQAAGTCPCAAVVTCSPTVNPVNLVQFTGNLGGLAYDVGPSVFPTTPFSYFLHSAWYCCPIHLPSQVSSLLFGELGTFTVKVSSSISPGIPTCEIVLRQATSVGTGFFDGIFNLAGNTIWHILVSVNCNTQVVQVYCNDLAISLTSGGFTASGQLQSGVSPNIALDIGSAFGFVYPAVTDIWEMATPGWIDLSVVGNRRKFINADLSPVDLGSNGQSPFGTSPQIYLTTSTSPNDIVNNLGSGGGPFILSGAVTLSWQTPGTCSCP